MYNIEEEAYFGVDQAQEHAHYEGNSSRDQFDGLAEDCSNIEEEANEYYEWLEEMCDTFDVSAGQDWETLCQY